MSSLLNLDTKQSEIVYDGNYMQSQLPTSTVSFTASESNSIISLSPSPSGYNCGDSPNYFNIDSSNIVENSSVMYADAEKPPYLEIIEQPIEKFRFRYLTEMRGTHGSLLGKSTNRNKKNYTYPTCQLMNYTGDAIIQCSLNQADTLNLLHHSHTLVVGKDKNGIKYPHIEVSPAKGYKAIFSGMGIIQAVKEKIVGELHEKLVKRMEFEKGRDITERENQQLRMNAEKETKNMNLNRVCLCFEAFHFVDNNWVSLCEPVLSNPISNEKCTETNELKITRLSTNKSPANGDKALYLFVEKVGKKNIKVRFFEKDKNDQTIWEDWGRFSEVDVHHQYAIALRTPPYRYRNIEEPVNCFIQLYRPLNKCYSEPKPFSYKPNRTIQTRKRARANTPHSSSELSTSLDEVQTISKDMEKMDLHNENFENFDEFLKDFSATCNTDELEALIGPAELLDSTEIQSGAQESMLKTDCVISSGTN